MPKLEISDPKILEAIKWHAEEAEKFDLVDKATRIVSFVSKKMAERSSTPLDVEMQMAYGNILARAKFVALPTLRDSEIVELLQNNFSLVFDIPNYDLWKKVRTKLISLPQFEDRDSLKKKIRDGLLESGQLLTKENLTISERILKGTVKNWLTDYRRALGTERVEIVKLSQYLVGGENTKILSAESRGRLDYLLKFYERLKISSIDLAGVEEITIFNVNGKLDIYEEGRIERIGHDIKEAIKQIEMVAEADVIKAELEAKYRGSETENVKIEAEMKKISSECAGDFKKLVNLLFKVANPMPGRMPNKIQAEAVLKILADKGWVDDLLEEKNFNEMMVAYFREKGRIVELEGFKVNPRAPQYVAAFLKHILMDKIGLNEDESARLGMQLFNTLAKGDKDSKYQGLVYFDLEAREFRWL